MKPIIVRYATRSGSQESVNFEGDCARINLSSRRITSIDLSPLRHCSNLREIRLQKNGLEKLYLSYNRLESVDLSPLKKCVRLRRLYLYNNRLTSLDLSPLGECMELERLSCYGNQFTRLDISPLLACSKLRLFAVDPSVALTADSSLQKLERLPRAIEEISERIVW